MTPGDPVAITRGARVQFRARVERIAWPGGDVILTDVRRLDGRVVLTTGFRDPMPLVLRAKGRQGTVIGYGGYGGEMTAEADEWDH